MSEPHNHPDHSGEALTIMRVTPVQQTPIVVSSVAQETDGRLPDAHSGYFDNRSPPLQWTNVPDVKAWAIIVEDPDAPQELPFVHWMIWNIQGEITSLSEGLPNTPLLATPQGGIQGRNGMGGYGYFGPRPPAGHGVHRYYFQVFALADLIPMHQDTPLEELVNALKGLTLASGQLVATYEAPQSAEADFSYKTAGGGGGKGAASDPDVDVVGNATLRGGHASPSDRARGETSRSDGA